MKKNKKTIQMGGMYQFVGLSMVGMLVWTVQGCSYSASLPYSSLHLQKKNNIQVKACVIPQLYLVCWQEKIGTTYYLLASRRGVFPSVCTVAAEKITFGDGSGKPMSLEQTNDLRLLRPDAKLLSLLCLAPTVVTVEKMRTINWSSMENNVDFELVYGTEACSLKGRALQALLGNMVRGAWSQAPNQIIPVALHCEAKVEQHLNPVVSRQLPCSSAPSQHGNMVPMVPGSGGCKPKVQTQKSGPATLPEVNETNILGSESTTSNAPSLQDMSLLEKADRGCGVSAQSEDLQAFLEYNRSELQPDSIPEDPMIPCSALLQHENRVPMVHGSGGCKAEAEPEELRPATLPEGNKINMLVTKPIAPNSPSRIPVLPDAHTLQRKDLLHDCLMSRRNGIDPATDSEEEGEREEKGKEKIISLSSQRNINDSGTVIPPPSPPTPTFKLPSIFLEEIRNRKVLNRVRVVQEKKPTTVSSDYDNPATYLMDSIPFIPSADTSGSKEGEVAVADSEWDGID